MCGCSQQLALSASSLSLEIPLSSSTTSKNFTTMVLGQFFIFEGPDWIQVHGMEQRTKALRSADREPSRSAYNATKRATIVGKVVQAQRPPLRAGARPILHLFDC